MLRLVEEHKLLPSIRYSRKILYPQKRPQMLFLGGSRVCSYHSCLFSVVYVVSQTLRN